MRFGGGQQAALKALIAVRRLRSRGQGALRRLGLIRARDGRDSSRPKVIPKIIWIYWAQGEAEAPVLVRASIDSWRRMNPEWDVRVLDASTAPDAADLPVSPETVPIQSYADLLRLRLLNTEGGVWADATVYCVTPLDHWLPFIAQKGFFAFRWTPGDAWMIWPNIGRDVTNWFIAAAPGTPIIDAWDSISRAYWSGGRTEPDVYFWPHFLFDLMRMGRRRFRRDVAEMPSVGCYGPHLVHDHITTGAMEAEDLRALLVSGAAPVQKLRWNWSDEQAAQVLALLAPESGP